MKIKPITPNEVGKLKSDLLPPAVIEVFNESIAKNWNGKSAKVYQNDVADAIASKLDITRQNVYDMHYLDVEPIYESAGWKIIYEKPGYHESWPAYFKFSKQNE